MNVFKQLKLNNQQSRYLELPTIYYTVYGLHQCNLWGKQNTTTVKLCEAVLKYHGDVS